MESGFVVISDLGYDLNVFLFMFYSSLEIVQP